MYSFQANVGTRKFYIWKQALSCLQRHRIETDIRKPDNYGFKID